MHRSQTSGSWARLKSEAESPRLVANLELVGGPGVKPGFAASDATVLFGYTTHHLELAPGIQPGSRFVLTQLEPERHHALNHASISRWRRCIELNSDLIFRKPSS